MKILGILLLATAAITVTARHKKEWQNVDVKKLYRERPQIFYKSDKPACSKGAGFYRDPQDCHQFIRCVDEFGTGRHFIVYVARCEPGLVFDENVSACNWPELAAPCSNSPDKYQEERKPLKQEQVPTENTVYEEQNPNKPYPQQQVIQETQISDSDKQQQEISAIEAIGIAQNPIFEKEEQKILDDIQNPYEQQQQIYQENVNAAANEEQTYQEAEIIDQIYQEEQKNQYEPINGNSKPEQVPSEELQQMLDQEIPQQSAQETISQESQSQWWVPEDNSQTDLPERTEQVPTSDPSQQPMFCSKDGFYRHPENCSQFIRCVKIGSGAFAVHFFECPNQLVFNEKDNACIVSDRQNCQVNIRKKRQASNTKLRCKGEGFFRHPVDCRAFYRCVKTETGYETHHFSCPANLVFDEEYTTCNWPEKAPPCNTQEQYKPTRKPVTPQRPAAVNRKPWSTSKPSNDFIDKSITEETYKRRNTEKPRPTTQSYETAAKCRSPGFFSNENDCTKFHKCVKKGNRYVRYDLSCPKNFVYDDMSQKCIAQRYATSCKRNKPYPPKQDDEESTLAPEPSSTSSSTSDSGNDAGTCEKEGYFRNPEDCNKFYRCVDFDGNGKEFVRYDFNCPEGLVFDEENSVCNWPDQSAPCDTRGTAGQGNGEDNENDGSETGGNENEDNDERGSEAGENEVSTSSEPSTSKPTESTSSSPADENKENGGSVDQDSDKESGSDGSDNECTKEGFYRNPDDCNKFYRCVDFDGEGKEFVRYDFSCPEGLVFDETNSVCNWPSDSEPCDIRSSGNGKEGSGKDGSESTSSSTPDRTTESSNDGNEQTTPRNEPSDNTPDSSSSSESSNGDSMTSTESSVGSTSGSRGSNDENNGECTEEGFFRNPDDCNKFYRCVDQNGNGQFVKYDFTCPEGLVFDEANSVCNWPDQSAPCDGGSSKGGQGTTSQGEGKDSESSQSTTTSTGSTSTKTSEESTESATSSTTESARSTNEEESKPTTERSTTSSSDRGEDDKTSDSSGSESENNKGECTEEGFFRNPEDCNKFYRCVDFNGDGQQFVRYDFDCPEGLVFDEVNSVCNWPDQSPKCETKSGSDDSKTTESGRDSSTSQTESSRDQTQRSTEQSTQSTSYESTEGSTERSTESSTGQPTSSSSSTTGDRSECTEPGFFRCKDDCSKFYRCVDEEGKLVRYDFKCPEGLIFDDKNKKCDWPSSTLTCESGDSSSTTSSYETSTSPTSTKSSTSSEASNKECSEEGFFRDPEDCSKYYRCIDEGDGSFTREDFSCAEDEVFDEEMRYCNRKDLAPPCDESETSQSQSTSSQTQSTTSGTSTSEGRSTTERSTSTQTTTGSTTKSDSFECSEPGFFRCPEDCTKFYRCVQDENENLVRYDFKCPDGLIFDENNKKCDWPSSELTCDTESSTTSSQTGDSTSQGTTSSGTTSSGETTSRETTSGGTSSSSECTEEGFFRNPDDCSKYYRCIDEGDGTFTREDFACEEDEVFDEEMNYCNKKDLAPPCDNSSTTESSGSTRSQTSEEAGSSVGTTSSSIETTSDSSGETSSTSSGSSSSGECEEEGFHRDPNDCNKFYRCVDFRGDGQSFTRYDFECPEGLVFDETNDVCNWPSSVPSCESGNESRGSTNSESSTTKSATETSDTSTSSTTPREQTSSTSRDQTSTTREQTTTTREQISTTIREQTSTTSRGSDSTTENQGTSPSTINEGSTSSERGTTSSEGTGSRGSGSSDNIECTEEGFFRHPEDCGKFYRCVDFAGTGESYVRYDFDCPEGLVFDEVNSVCNWPNQSPPCESGSRAGNGNNDSENTDSGESSSTGSSSTSSSSPSYSSTENSRTTRQSETSTTPRDQTTRSSTSTTTSSEAEFRCEEEGFFKHPSDCRKYYECKQDEDTGELVKIDCECPEGQVWDNEGWYCNAEELSPPCESDSNSSSFKCTKEGFFRDPEDCTRYYKCNKTGPGENDFSSERYQCDEGLVFDEEGRYCNAPELSEPCDDSSSTSSGTTPAESSRGTSSIASSGGSTGSTSSESSSGTNNCTSEGFFRDPDDCTKYYQCSRNEETGEFDRSDYSCPDGRIFDEGSNYCNEPELSEQPCDSDNNGQSTTSRQGGTQSTTSEGRQSSGSTSSTGTRSGGPECTQEGFFRHPDDCNKFYRCVDFAGTGESYVRYDFDCPEVLHFDEVNSVCNWPTMTPPCESNNRVFLSNRAV